jgi:hypothetical protein
MQCNWDTAERCSTCWQACPAGSPTHPPPYPHTSSHHVVFYMRPSPHPPLFMHLLLQVLEYLLIRGSSSAVQLGHSREVQHLLASLSHFEAMGLGQGGGDAGVNVRLR